MKVSIIIPVYNKEKYLTNLFADLQMQSFTDYECLLIDDGSTDGSAAICDEICGMDARFRVFHLTNGGVSKARNYGLECAKGEYITFIDADDRVVSTYLQNLIQLIECNRADIVISGIEKFWVDSDKVEYVAAPFCGSKKKSEILPEFAKVQKETGIFGFCVAKIFKKDTVKDIRFDESLTLAEDFDFYLKLYQKVKNFYFDDKCYYRYLQEAENASVCKEDAEVDYLAQLKINLRYKRFLSEYGEYHAENKEIIDTLISNYIFFTLFHSPAEKAYTNINVMQKMLEGDIPKKKGISWLQDWLMYLFRRNQKRLIRYTLQIYRMLARMGRNLKSLFIKNKDEK